MAGTCCASVIRTSVLLLCFCTGLAKSPICSMDNVSYPPALDPLPSGLAKNVSWVTVDLDQDPRTRWAHVVEPYAADIAALTDVITDTLRKLLGNSTVDDMLHRLDDKIDEYLVRLPKDYGAEIRGIANATGMEPSVMFVYNMFYTVFGACTSIVAQSADGEIFHARNLDFGLWPSFTLKDKNFWKLASVLRPLIVNVKFVRGGTELYHSTTFAGFVGVHTASKTGAFSLTVDTKFDGHVDAGLIKWWESLSDPDTELTMLTRSVFEDETDYNDALTKLNQTKVIGPAYIIFSGVEKGQGAVITKGAAGALKPDGETVDIWSLTHEIANGTFFLLQTNYDHGKPPPAFDNRRDPGRLCMEQLTPSGFSFNGLYNVLNAVPNLNRLTTFTTLMHARSGSYEAYRQICIGLKCPLF